MNDRDVDQLARSALAAGAPDAGSHPEPDTLFHYHAGELSATDADAVQGHLALCPPCARAVLDFEIFPHIDAPSDEDDVPTVDEIEAGWADVQARLGRGDEGDGPAGGRSREGVVVALPARGDPPPPPRPAPARRVPAWLPAAAAVLVAATGGYFWGTRGRAIVNVPNISLFPEDEQVRSEAGPQFERRTIPPAVDEVRFAFHTRQEPGSGPYSLEVRDQHGRSVGRPVEGLIADESGNLAFTLTGNQLSAGRYRFTLRAPEDRSVVTEYGLELQVE